MASCLHEHAIRRIDTDDVCSGGQSTFGHETGAGSDIHDDAGWGDACRSHCRVPNAFAKRRAPHLVPFVRNTLEVFARLVAHDALKKLAFHAALPQHNPDTNIRYANRCFCAVTACAVQPKRENYAFSATRISTGIFSSSWAESPTFVLFLRRMASPLARVWKESGSSHEAARRK